MQSDGRACAQPRSRLDGAHTGQNWGASLAEPGADIEQGLSRTVQSSGTALGFYSDHTKKGNRCSM